MLREANGRLLSIYLLSTLYSLLVSAGFLLSSSHLELLVSRPSLGPSIIIILSHHYLIQLQYSVSIITRAGNMRYYSIILLTLSASTSALNIWTRKTKSCPSVWSDIASELQSAFAGCGRDAHGAIRAPFHDCINNGCDGSLILSDECSRPENAGLSGICTKLADWAAKYDVSAADMIQFAAATAISQCPLGPKVQALVGRKDSKKAADVGSVPSSRDSVDKILGAFSAKGFSAKDVVALMGTHSVAVQVNDDPAQAGKSLDSTPSVYDMTYYKETKDGTAPYSLQSDRLLSNSSQVSLSFHLPIFPFTFSSYSRLKHLTNFDSQTADTWSSFADDADAWNSAFTDAWNRFAVIGNKVDKLQDCSSLIPASSASKKRQAAVARFTMRMSAKFRL
jgi:hypothetical protein